MKTIHNMGRQLPGLVGKSILTQGELNLLDHKIRESDCRCFIEIGTWTGTSCAWLAERHPSVQFICFDTFVNDTAGLQIQNWITNKRPNMMLIIGDSNDLTTLDLQADIIFVDGDHTLDGCRVDLLNAATSLHLSGLLICHDYTHEKFGVKKAVDEMLARHHDYKIVDACDSIVVIQDVEELDQEEEM